jgi:hypothetical protein
VDGKKRSQVFEVDNRRIWGYTSHWEILGGYRGVYRRHWTSFLPGSIVNAAFKVDKESSNIFNSVCAVDSL